MLTAEWHMANVCDASAIPSGYRVTFTLTHGRRNAGISSHRRVSILAFPDTKGSVDIVPEEAVNPLGDGSQD
jgi:hypothetical protein